jgi:hypothetical protein
MASTNIDLDRVVFDPEYRRLVIDVLNREAVAEETPLGQRMAMRSRSGATGLGPSALQTQ